MARDIPVQPVIVKRPVFKHPPANCDLPEIERLAAARRAGSEDQQQTAETSYGPKRLLRMGTGPCIPKNSSRTKTE